MILQALARGVELVVQKYPSSGTELGVQIFPSLAEQTWDHSSGSPQPLESSTPPAKRFTWGTGISPEFRTGTGTYPESIKLGKGLNPEIYESNRPKHILHEQGVRNRNVHKE